ncbi:MAG: hypothetical protein F4Y47_04510 [Acidobacteriia bacterium]|nr:hypothetical protein [Terriglobia bacterium]
MPPGTNVLADAPDMPAETACDITGDGRVFGLVGKERQPTKRERARNGFPQGDPLDLGLGQARLADSRRGLPRCEFPGLGAAVGDLCKKDGREREPSTGYLLSGRVLARHPRAAAGPASSVPSIENRFQRVRDATLREEDPLIGNDLMLRVLAVVVSQSRSSCGALSGWRARTSIPADPPDCIRCHGFTSGKAANRELDPDRLPRSKPNLGPDGVPRMRRHYGEADDAGERRGMLGIGPVGMVPVSTNLDRGYWFSCLYVMVGPIVLAGAIWILGFLLALIEPPPGC